MPRNTSISLGDHFAGFVDEKVQSGRYSSASDVVRAGYRADACVALAHGFANGELGEPDDTGW